jgi:DNA repair protein RecO (recombination protein O)
VPTYRDEAVVLRTQKLGEADRIVTVLSKSHGKFRAVAKGVRRTASKFGSRLEPFMVADMQFYVGRSLDTVTQAEPSVLTVLKSCLTISVTRLLTSWSRPRIV